jgi:RHS repeat-associated protein
VDNYGVTNDFGYNVRSEVISAMMSSNQFGYAYDPIGNRLAATNNAEALSYLANELNQYTSISNGATLEPSYDDDGNLVTYGDWTFTWNGENRLVAASNAAHVVTYAYDHVGRLFAKTTFEASDLGTPISDLHHVWDGFNIIAEISVLPSSVQTNWNVWGLDLSGSLQGAGGVGGLLAVTVAGGDDSGHYVAAYDANGNITDYVDDTGAIVAHREYGPFGETTALSGPMQNAFTHWWSTKPWDPITGFSEYEFRMYSPELGRWLSRDPISEEAFVILHGDQEIVMRMVIRGGAENLYGFVRNGPTDDMDILGLAQLQNNTGFAVLFIGNVPMRKKCREYLEKKHPPLTLANINGIPMVAPNGYDTDSEPLIKDVDGYWTKAPPGSFGYGIKIKLSKTLTTANITTLEFLDTSVASLAAEFSGGSFNTHVNTTWATTYRATVVTGMTQDGCPCTQDDLDNVDWAVARGRVALSVFPNAK